VQQKSKIWHSLSDEKVVNVISGHVHSRNDQTKRCPEVLWDIECSFALFHGYNVQQNL